MSRLGLMFAVLLLVGACAPASPQATPAPTKAASSPAAAATKPATEAAKPASSPTAAPTAAIKPLNPPVTVRIGVTGSVSEGFFYIADAKSYLAEEGLKADYMRFNNGPEMLAPLVTGDLDIGAGGPGVGLFNAAARGMAPKIIADNNRSSKGLGSMTVMVRKDLIDSGQIKSFPDLKGKTIATPSMANPGERTVDTMLQMGGLKEDDVKVVVLPFPNMSVAFANKSIDVGVDVDPFNAQLVDNGLAVRWKGQDEILPDEEGEVLMASPTFLKDKREAAQRFVTAYVRAIRDYVNAFQKNIDKAQIISILTQNMDIKSADLYPKMSVVGVNPDGYVSSKTLGDDQDWYILKGYMQQKIDLNQVIDNQFVDYAIQRLGKYQP